MEQFIMKGGTPLHGEVVIGGAKNAALGIIAGALLAFTLSLDDFILSFFTSGPESQTLPLYIYGSLKRGISPQIHALSTIIF